MATTLVTLVGDVSDAIGTDFDYRRTKAYVRHNTTKVVTDGDVPIHLGAGTVNLNGDGTFELPNIVASTSLIENLQATVYVDYEDRSTRKRVVQAFGPYDLSGETGTVDIRDLEAVQALDPSFASTTMAAMQQLLDDMQEISGLTGEDAAVQYLINNPSLTKTALTASTADSIEPGETDPQAAVDARAAAAVEPRAFTAEFWCDFTAQPIGDRPEVDDAGHALQYDKNSNTLSAFDIIEADNFAGTSAPIRGLSSAATTDVSASYVAVKELENTGTRRRFSGEFVLRSPGGYGGVCIGWWKERPGDNGTFPTIVPNAPCHLELYADRWVLSKFTGGSSGVTATPTSLIASTLWGTPLAYLTRHRVDLLVEDGRLTVDLPDGSQQVVTDSSILVANAVYPFFEIQASDQDTQGKATWLWVDGDSTIDRRNFFVRQIASLGRKIVALDPSNTQSGTGRVLSGLRNAASGAGAVIPGGDDNVAASAYSRAGGSWAKVRAQGHDVFTGGRFSVAGDANAGNHHMRVTTTNATPTTLSVTGTTGTAGLIPATAGAIACSALVSAYRSSNGESAMYRVDFAIKRTTSGSTAIVGTPVVTVLYEDDSTWDVAPYANTALDLWGLQVTGAASKTLHWNARITAVEVT